MKRIGSAILILLFSTMNMTGEQVPTKHRIAVLNFSHANVLGSTEAIFGTNVDIGQYISDMLADQLTTHGVFRVIDRGAINRALSNPVPILKEKKRFTGGLPDINDERVEEPTPNVNRIGMLLDVNQIIQLFQADAIITGEITEFGQGDEKKESHLETWKRQIKHEATKKKAVVGITARMIDLNTGETLASANVQTESLHSSSGLLAAKGLRNNVSNLKAGSFSRTILGEAVQQAVDQLAHTFEQKTPVVTVINPIQFSGLVADVSDTDVTINIGAVNGVHVGDVLYVTRTTRKIKDPTSGSTLRPVEGTIGQITITNVKPFYAIGTFSAGSEDDTPAVNDIVRNTPINN